MMDLKDLPIAMSIKQKQKQKIQTMTTLYDFILILLNDQIKKYEEVMEIAIGQGNCNRIRQQGVCQTINTSKITIN